MQNALTEFKFFINEAFRASFRFSKGRVRAEMIALRFFGKFYVALAGFLGFAFFSLAAGFCVTAGGICGFSVV